MCAAFNIKRTAFVYGLGMFQIDNSNIDAIVDDYGDTYYWGDEQGMYIALGVRFKNELLLFGTIGYDLREADGWYITSTSGPTTYTRGTQKQIDNYSLQLRYPIKNLAIGIGYDNRRKLVFGIGAAF